jgi:hypothetical protein
MSGSWRSNRRRSVWANRIPGELGNAWAASSIRLTRLGLPSELHEKRPAVGDRVHLRRAGKDGGAVISRERRFELAHGLKNLADRVVRFGGFRRGGRRALGPIHRLVEPVEILQRQRFRGERARMRRRKGDERVERAQCVGVAMTRGLDAGEIDVGVHEPWIELDRAPRHAFGAVEIALIEVEIGEIAVGLRVIGSQLERRSPAFLGLRRQPQPLEGVGEVVDRLGVVGLQRQRAFEARPAFVELERLL